MPLGEASSFGRTRRAFQSQNLGIETLFVMHPVCSQIHLPGLAVDLRTGPPAFPLGPFLAKSSWLLLLLFLGIQEQRVVVTGGE